MPARAGVLPLDNFGTLSMQRADSDSRTLRNLWSAAGE
jgi:hypothetical protein